MEKLLSQLGETKLFIDRSQSKLITLCRTIPTAHRERRRHTRCVFECVLNSEKLTRSASVSCTVSGELLLRVQGEMEGFTGQAEQAALMKKCTRVSITVPVVSFKFMQLLIWTGDHLKREGGSETCRVVGSSLLTVAQRLSAFDVPRPLAWTEHVFARFEHGLVWISRSYSHSSSSSSH